MRSRFCPPAFRSALIAAALVCAQGAAAQPAAQSPDQAQRLCALRRALRRRRAARFRSFGSACGRAPAPASSPARTTACAFRDRSCRFRTRGCLWSPTWAAGARGRAGCCCSIRRRRKASGSRCCCRSSTCRMALRVGIDRRVYASTVDSVFRFDPLAAAPESTIEVIVRGLPGSQPTLSDGTKLDAQSPSAEALRVRQDRPALREHRRAERQMRHQDRGERAVRRRRGRVRDGGGLGVHAAGRRRVSGLEAGRAEPAVRGLRAGPAQLDGARRASAVSGRRLSRCCRPRTPAICPIRRSRTKS